MLNKPKYLEKVHQTIISIPIFKCLNILSDKSTLTSSNLLNKTLGIQTPRNEIKLHLVTVLEPTISNVKIAETITYSPPSSFIFYP